MIGKEIDMRRILLLAVIGLIMVVNAQADVLVFKNGDRLTGKFVRIVDGNLVFKADMAGEVTIGLDKVQTFWTDEPIEIHMKDGSLFKSKVLESKDAGKVSVEATKVIPAQKIAFEDITSVNPPPKPKVKWKGNLTGGFTSTHGNTFSESGSLSFNATRRGEKDRINVFGLYTVARTKEDKEKYPGVYEEEKVTTDESFMVGGKYSYFYQEKCYAFINGSFKKDHIADLDRRIISGVGLGRQWIETDDKNFSTDAGLSILCEKYTTRDQTTWVKEIDKTDDLSAQLGYHFDWLLTKKLTFIHNLTYYPNIQGRVSDYFLNLDAELRLALSKSWFSSLKYILDYDSTPGEGLTSTDSKYILGLGWTF